MITIACNCRRSLATSSSSSDSLNRNDDLGRNNNQQTFVYQRPPPIKPFPLSPRRTVPDHIARPPYADSGIVPHSMFSQVLLHDEASAAKMRHAARLARHMLDYACDLVCEGRTTDELDEAVHNYIISNNAYPSPLNYAGFPKSLCTSINEVICHGIPDKRPLEFGDVVSLDVSCFVNGVHGDNCATVIVGDSQPTEGSAGSDWRGVPYKMDLKDPAEERRMVAARRLVHATRESLYRAIGACRPGGCLSDIGAAVHEVADSYGYDTVQKYRGHGISHEFHCLPFVKHYRNNDRMILRPGMIFTIEPMLTEGSWECYEWDDEWTVATVDGGLAAQFEHTVLITESGVEILTLPEDLEDIS